VEDLDDKIKAKQDHLLDLKRKIESRQQLLSKLREIGEKSKQDTVEYYFQQLNKNSDELALKDKQIQIHHDKVRDLERMLSVARSQAAESNRLTFQVNSLEEEVSLMREGREGELRGMEQEREKWNFERKGLREELDSLTDVNKKLSADLADAHKQREEAEKTRNQLHAKLEDTVKQKEKITGDTKNEVGKVE
jgi:chromosome segregation ATPase